MISVRYIVNDVNEAVAFYSTRPDFNVDIHPGPGVASLSRGDLRLLLNRPGAGGAGQAAGGMGPSPGGWNRFQLEVADLAGTVQRLRGAGCRFRNDIVTGNGARQVLLDDPSGNAIELFQPF